MSDSISAIIPANDDWARPLAERQLQLLGELAELGLDVARAVAAEARREGADVDAAAMAYARVSRAVRLTIMLQSKLIEELKQEARFAAVRAEAVREEAFEARRERAGRIVRRLARVACDDEDDFKQLTREAAERLDDDDVYGVLSRPMSEVIDLICGDLGIDPQWAELAMEAWAREEIESGAPGAPLAFSSPSASATPALRPAPADPPPRPPGRHDGPGSSRASP